MIKKIKTPILSNELDDITIGDKVEISGIIYTARDAVITKLKKMINEESLHKLPISLEGIAIFHTAFSIAGFGPTSSNKEEIESGMGILSKVGVKLHLGKGEISKKTIDEMAKYNSVFIVVPPITALLQERLISKKLIAFPEEGMEAMYELKVDRIPGIVATINGKSIYDR